MDNESNIPVIIQGVTPNDYDTPVVSVEGAQGMIANLLAVSLFNTGSRPPDEKDFQFMVSGIFRIIQTLYPYMHVNDLADALWRGSIGEYGEVYGVNLLSINKWLQQKSIEIKLLRIAETAADNSKRQREDIERLGEIKKAYEKIYPLGMEEEKQGKKSYNYFLSDQLPKLTKHLADLKPSLAELVFMVVQYCNKRATEPEPREFLKEIRLSRILTEDLISKIYEFIDSLTEDKFSNNTSSNN